jgi:hypothetical protein
MFTAISVSLAMDSALQSPNAVSLVRLASLGINSKGSGNDDHWRTPDGLFVLMSTMTVGRGITHRALRALDRRGMDAVGQRCAVVCRKLAR